MAAGAAGEHGRRRAARPMRCESLLPALCGLLVLAPLLPAVRAGRGDEMPQVLPEECSSEWQRVMCAELAAAPGPALQSCCAAHAPKPRAAAPPAGAAAPVWKRPGQRGRDYVPRGDLGPFGVVGAAGRAKIDWLFGNCTDLKFALVPAFQRDELYQTQTDIVRWAIPALPRGAIARVKAAALAAASPERAVAVRRLRAVANAGRFDLDSGFLHPAGFAGPAELVLMRTRLAANSSLTLKALDSLLTGRGVPPKVVGSNGWAPPTGTPAAGHGGPFPMQVFKADWGGWAVDPQKTCPLNYPKDAPLNQCGHYALVEMDGAMSYKYALAHAATGDERYALRAAEALRAWSEANVHFGLNDRNGPLEAAWALGAMARSMDMLRATWPGFNATEHLAPFQGWVDSVLMKQLDYFVSVNTYLLQGRDTARTRLHYGNWAASVADAMMAYGVLTDDRARYQKGVTIYRAVVDSYFKWGRGQWARGRIVGESTETLRDVYHTLFAVGSLMQAAETAWGQNEDLYSENDAALAAALELHARIINAYEDGDEAALPSGFKFFESMPDPPKGCAWSWSIETQGWTAYNKTGSKNKCGELKDGFKYLLGITYLPTGFELGYNHFSGRLGIKMPETARLLSRHPVDWFAFCWGLGTLTHADTARDLWRAGITEASLCEPRVRGGPGLGRSTGGSGGGSGAAAGGGRRAGGKKEGGGGRSRAGDRGGGAAAEGRAGGGAQGKRKAPKPGPAAVKSLTVETVSVKVLTVATAEIRKSHAPAKTAKGRREAPAAGEKHPDAAGRAPRPALLL
ncbi:hypothetical protein Rsub_01850 [Raphidocelis subcapitata]|uniref:Alginate lyase domain-containing protein n=1 Tax=Raphidocelis subcapitata TaxID=307507 RepID=A0A2V0NUA6_9CHLO|nr:hypothetical protein Rsub_01850 [Raphidocelis subcapitata]|eukprot:GBF89133.1 hypothetical protein Rsub_01850 [Raphidocelis subcapitata]